MKKTAVMVNKTYINRVLERTAFLVYKSKRKFILDDHNKIQVDFTNTYYPETTLKFAFEEGLITFSEVLDILLNVC